MNTSIKQLEDIILPYCAAIFTLLCISAPRFANTFDKLSNPASSYLVHNMTSFMLTLLSISITSIILVLAKLSNDNILRNKTCNLVMWCSLFSLISIWVSDLAWMAINLTLDNHSLLTFNNVLLKYLIQETWLYFIILGYIIALNYLKPSNNNNLEMNSNKHSPGTIFTIFTLLIPFCLIGIPVSFNILIFYKSNAITFYDLGSQLRILLNFIYMFSALTIIGIARFKVKRNIINQQSFLQIIHINGVTCLCFFVFQLLASIFPYFTYDNYSLLDKFSSGAQVVKTEALGFGVNFFLLIMLMFLNKYYKKMQFSTGLADDQTSGNHGTAKWADESYLKQKGLYKLNKTLIGIDKYGQQLSYPICNRTIIANSGGGKSSGCIIPALLTEDRPVFCFDPKGELWAVSAKHRAFGFGRNRKVIAIDPFQLIQKQDLSKNKTRNLCRIYQVNPLDYISNDPKQRDRQLTNIAQACVVRDEKQHSDTHWYDYAEIFIKGLIEYILDNEKNTNSINLITARELLINNEKQMRALIELMQVHGGKHSKATAAMLENVGDEERGSIWSTTYRQLSWLIDANIMAIFNESNIDLRDFLKGDMDIFVILPEDQIKEHNRVMRLIFASIINILSQTEPSQLPQSKILFILDELGQLGTSQDVQRAIEILRYKQVIIWAVFQNYGQIKQYQKPENFTEAQIKQFFSTDDVATMEWIQKLGGQKTVKVNSLAQNTNISSQKSSILSSNISNSDNISVQEVGVPLIHLNQIREMNAESQLVFIKEIRPILCKRLSYYKDAYLNSIADPNPYVKIDS